METSSSSPDRAVKWTRWTVRILSLIFAAFWFYIMIGESLEGRTRPQNPPIAIGAVLELTIISISLVGLLVAWRWEFVGGAVSLVAFVVANLIDPAFLVLFPVAITAILYLVCWAADRKRANATRAAGAGLPG